jgi:hypothetical protein
MKHRSENKAIPFIMNLYVNAFHDLRERKKKGRV